MQWPHSAYRQVSAKWNAHNDNSLHISVDYIYSAVNVKCSCTIK